MLTVVIPALNEEQSIRSICERCLAEAPRIMEATGEEVEILVVDDGSTDRTAQIARSIEGIRVLALRQNHGYGAALLAGFSGGRGELIGFLDADGTCDPAFFVPMVAAVHNGASVALGNRLGAKSRMPRVRRVGNRFFAALIRALSGAAVVDSASGMRVLRRDALALLEPLPSGLDFTPAMSCRAALDPRLSLVEVPMTYAERAGRSKLGVVRDGFRFLRVILEIAVTYRPLLLFGACGALMLAVAGAYAIAPLLSFIESGTLAEHSVYRILTILVLTAGGFGFVYAGALADHAQTLVHPRRPHSRAAGAIRVVFFTKPLLIAGCCFLLALGLNGAALWQYLTTGSIRVHWARVAFGAISSLAGLQLVAFGLVQRVLTLLAERSDRDQRRSDPRVSRK